MYQEELGWACLAAVALGLSAAGLEVGLGRLLVRRRCRRHRRRRHYCCGRRGGRCCRGCFPVSLALYSAPRLIYPPC